MGLWADIVLAVTESHLPVLPLPLEGGEGEERGEGLCCDTHWATAKPGDAHMDIDTHACVTMGGQIFHLTISSPYILSDDESCLSMFFFRQCTWYKSLNIVWHTVYTHTSLCTYAFFAYVHMYEWETEKILLQFTENTIHMNTNQKNWPLGENMLTFVDLSSGYEKISIKVDLS